MKRLTVTLFLMLGISVLTYNCSYVFSTSPTEVNIDSFSIEMAIYDLGIPVSFDSVESVNAPILKEVFFMGKTIQERFVLNVLKKQKSYGAAAYARQEQFISGVNDLVVTSNKDIHFADSVIPAGTNLMHRCSFNMGDYRANPWRTANEFLRRTKASDRFEFLNMRISSTLDSPIDQHFTFTFTHLNGESVSAISPRVLAQ